MSLMVQPVAVVQPAMLPGFSVVMRPVGTPPAAGGAHVSGQYRYAETFSTVTAVLMSAAVSNMLGAFGPYSVMNSGLLVAAPIPATAVIAALNDVPMAP